MIRYPRVEKQLVAMQYSDLENVTTAAIVVTTAVADFPTLFDALLAKQPSPFQHYLLVHNREEKTIPIELVRDLKHSTAYALGSLERQELILLWAELLSLPAQQAILKLLEEPPAGTRVWLVTAKPQSLLETIRSRCVSLVLTDKPDDHLKATVTLARGSTKGLVKGLQDISLESITTANYSQLITMAAVPKDRAEAAAWCNELLRACHHTDTTTSYHTQQLLLNTIEQLQQNANVKLALEQCLFQMRLLCADHSSVV